MKGLLVKEFRFLLGQKSNLLIFIGLGLFFLLTNDNVSFGIMFAMMLSAMFATSSITFDAHENGMAFLLTLPVQRKSYVVTKYLFSLMVIVAMGAIMLVLVLGGSACGAFTFEWNALMEIYAMAISTGLVISSLLIPVYVIFGAEKSRVAALTIVGIGWACYFIFAKILGNSLGDVVEFLGKLDDLSGLQITLLATGVLAVVVGVSMFITIKGLEKKEY